MFAYLRKPQVDLGTLILRLGLAAIFILHGAVYLDQNRSFTDILSPTMQRVLGWSELVCGIALLVGFLSRLAALGVIAIMIGALEMVKKEFFPISFSPSGYDFEAGAAYNFIIIICCLALVVLGSGRVSLDHLFFGRKKAVSTAEQPSAMPPPAATASSAGPFERAR